MNKSMLYFVTGFAVGYASHILLNRLHKKSFDAAMSEYKGVDDETDLSKKIDYEMIGQRLESLKEEPDHLLKDEKTMVPYHEMYHKISEKNEDISHSDLKNKEDVMANKTENYNENGIKDPIRLTEEEAMKLLEKDDDLIEVFLQFEPKNGEIWVSECLAVDGADCPLFDGQIQDPMELLGKACYDELFTTDEERTVIYNEYRGAIFYVEKP